ncbi:MAG: methyltransferase domain-containing protein [Gammaproteobacteria bacterium]
MSELARASPKPKRVGFGESIRYGDGEFDGVFADNVFEHLPNPQVFAESFECCVEGRVSC